MRKRKVEKQAPENLIPTSTSEKKTSGDSKQNSKGFDNPDKIREKMWGKEPNTYGTLEESVYRERLQGMTKWDLMQECSKRGLVPHDDNGRMIKRLMSQFKEFVAIATRGTKPAPKNFNKPSPKTQKYINSILG